MGFGEVLHGGPVDAAELARVRDVLLFEGDDLAQRQVKFWSLLVLSTGIATFGLIGDSAATVIGAMIVAPLMIPIMGTAYGVAIGGRKATWNSLALVVAGGTMAVALAWLLAQPFLRTIDPVSNSQIAARTAPRLIDLAAALATGLAGAFATSRSDVSDTLPGVAIAISLVPPLATVGICLAVGQPTLAMGALLLFITNVLAIIAAGTLVFTVMGFSSAAVAERTGSKAAAVTTVVVLMLTVCVPLGIQGRQVALANIAEQRVSTAAEVWLQGSDYRVVAVQAGEPILLRVSGNGELPPIERLSGVLKGTLWGAPVRLEVEPARVVVIETR